MDITIQYKHKRKLYSVRVMNPYTEKFSIIINNVLCNYVSPDNLIKDIDGILHKSISRYNAELKLGLIKQ